jgi:hypothetical protein
LFRILQVCDLPGPLYENFVRPGVSSAATLEAAENHGLRPGSAPGNGQRRAPGAKASTLKFSNLATAWPSDAAAPIKGNPSTDVEPTAKARRPKNQKGKVSKSVGDLKLTNGDADHGVTGNLKLIHGDADHGVAGDLNLINGDADHGVAGDLNLINGDADHGVSGDLNLINGDADHGVASDLKLINGDADHGVASDLKLINGDADRGVTGDPKLINRDADHGVTGDLKLSASDADHGVASDLKPSDGDADGVTGNLKASTGGAEGGGEAPSTSTGKHEPTSAPKVKNAAEMALIEVKWRDMFMEQKQVTADACKLNASLQRALEKANAKLAWALDRLVTTGVEDEYASGEDV